jgi:hypothetical protein
LLYTAPGQADLADLGTLNVCGGCIHWDKGKVRGRGYCNLYQRRMHGRGGASIAPTQRACRAFEMGRIGATGK